MDVLLRGWKLIDNLANTQEQNKCETWTPEHPCSSAVSTS
jgi:hypothetical protein